MKGFLRGSLFPVLFWAVVYLLLPSANNANDAFMYAADIRQGTDLFYAHHLFYNGLAYAFAKLFSVNRTLPLLCLINALSAAVCLALSRSIFRKFVSDGMAAACLWLLGACWGLCRFATDGETYVVPLVFSLWASLAFVSRCSPFKVSFRASAACLFHQIHFFWWLGLGIGMVLGNRKGKKPVSTVFGYMLGSLIVPFAYVCVYYAMPNKDPDLLHFVFHDYFYVDSVGFSIREALVLTPINLVRTFVQVHGYIPALVGRYHLILTGPVLAVLFFLFSFFRTGIRWPRSSEKDPDRLVLADTHLLIAFLQLGFAFFSNGNAEFMVMIPFALAVWAVFRLRISPKKLSFLAAGLLLWNLFLGLLPYCFVELNPYPAVVRHIEAHPDKAYVIGNYAMVYNMLRYENPRFCENVLKAYPDGGIFYTDKGNRAFVSRSSVSASLSGETDGIPLRMLGSDTLRFDLGKWILFECSADTVLVR